MTVEHKAIAKTTSKTFDVRAPYVSEGRVNVPLAATADMWITLKVNAEGGENAVHTHMDEDHFFIVMEGEVTFFDGEGGERVLGPYQGIMIPHGAYYRYLNTGEGNLVLLRTGCRAGNPNGPHRLDPDGKPLVGSSKENKHVDGVPIPGKFFGRQK